MPVFTWFTSIGKCEKSETTYTAAKSGNRDIRQYPTSTLYCNLVGNNDFPADFDTYYCPLLIKIIYYKLNLVNSDKRIMAKTVSDGF